MDIHDCIVNATKMDNSYQAQTNVKWTSVTKNKKQETPPPRGRGEIPYQLEVNNKNYLKGFQNLNQRKYNTRKPNLYQSRSTFQQKKNTSDEEHNSENDFAQIAPSVREANGGWNTQSNEVIERRQRERQQKYAEENSELISSDSLDTTYTTVSSETTESYKTTLQNSYELMIANQQATSEKLINKSIERYKKNALMLGLLRSAQNEYLDKEETSTESSADFLDASGSMSDIVNGMADMNVKEDQEAMREDRLGMLFQSHEDEDVYYHPLKEQIKEDPEWQNLRLKRQGTEVVHSARQYYLSIDNDSFEFQQHNSKQ